MTKLEMLNEMFKGTPFERNIKDHIKRTKKYIEKGYNFWKQQEDKKYATSFVDAWLG